MSKGKILVVDDEVYIVQILEFSLSRIEGYDVVTASDGEEALEKVAAEHPDLIVLDVMMPKMDGYETCKRLKEEEATRSIPVILLSAKGRTIDQNKGFEAGADDYITKPFSPRKLIEKINYVLGKSNGAESTPAMSPAPGSEPNL